MEFFQLLTSSFEHFMGIMAFCCGVPLALGIAVSMIVEQWRQEK